MSSSEIPSQRSKNQDWVVLSFISGDSILLTSLDEIREILPVTSLTTIPGVKSWLRGMISYRSQIFPVTDLSGFLIQKMTTITRDSRILLIPAKEGNFGLLIDKVQGITQIKNREYQTNPVSLFSCKALMQDPRFRNIVYE